MRYEGNWELGVVLGWIFEYQGPQVRRVECVRKGIWSLPGIMEQNRKYHDTIELRDKSLHVGLPARLDVLYARDEIHPTSTFEPFLRIMSA